jgi:hypothetical protein
MYRYKRGSESIIKIALLVGTTILIHLILTPLAYTKDLETSANKQYDLFTLSEDVYIINEGKTYELLNNVRIGSILSRNLRDIERLLKRVFDTTLPLVLTFTICIIYSLTFFKKSRRRGSILAWSLGGHAPPVLE